MLLRTNVTPQPVTDVIVTQHIEARLANVPPGPRREQSEQFTRKLVTHQTLPAFGDVRFGEDGRIWVSEFVIDERMARTWSAFAADGALDVRVSIPGGWRVLRFGPDYVLAVVRDDLDRESVRRYPIVTGA
jgi:hypothetical protein